MEDSSEQPNDFKGSFKWLAWTGVCLVIPCHSVALQEKRLHELV